MSELIEKNRILELPKHVADKIAAGEVVDRPLSIIKELIENSIDAGATSITLEIISGGKKYIRVTDNGSGIKSSDIELAFKRHATSKIRDDKDLESIHSLGFRGEALASIAAVSRVELITKTADEKIGTSVKLSAGQQLEKTTVGCPDGTTIIIEDLFFNTPARHKFMKPDSTESSLIIDFVSKMTLAYPEIKIRLINNGNILFSTPGKGDIYTNILTIYSREIGEKLLHIKDIQDGISLEAYVSAPDKSKTNRKSQIFFVNGRYINSKLIENALVEAYSEKLFDGRHPIAFIFLNISPDKVDVNIHPNKKEVRFDNDREVKEYISTVIRNRLNTKDAAPLIKAENKNIFKQNYAETNSNFNEKETSYSVRPEKPKEEQIDIKRLLETKRAEENQQNIQKEKMPEQQNIQKEKVQEEQIFNEEKNDIKTTDEKTINNTKLEIKNQTIHLNIEENKTKTNPFNIDKLKITGAIFGTYITAVEDNNFYFIDQHAAHERIFYEQLISQYKNEEKIKQLILNPFVINVTYAIKNDADQMLSFINSFGFSVEVFGNASFIVKEIPMFMDIEEAKDFLEYIFDNLSEDKEIINEKKVASIINKACKKSVKAHDLLDIKEMEQLINDLMKTSNPYSCPHGRPTFIRITNYEIERMFKRV